MLKYLLNLSRFNKQLTMVFVDSIFLVLILLASFSLRLGHWYWPENDLIWIIFGTPVIAIPIFVRFGLYRAVIRYISFKLLWAVVQAASFYALVWGVVGFMMAVDGIPRSVILINWFLTILIIGGLRMTARWFFLDLDKINQTIKNNVVVYGAGSAGRQLLTALQQSSEYHPVAFIDDKYELQKQSIGGVEVVSLDDIENLIRKYKVNEVLLALPSVSRVRRNEIIDLLEPYQVMVRSLPGVSELAQGKINISDLKEVSIKDLLGRDTVNPNKGLLSKNITDKVVLVTGAGGSIGSELCRQIVFLKPKVLLLYEMTEFNLYEISQQLSVISHQCEVIPLLGSVNNRGRLSNIFKIFNVQTIYHAAAYKHVPIVELNNTEGIYNNIFGTLNCAQVAIDTGVETFVLISTDKAVRPTNTMGATKRTAELVLQSLDARQSGTKFTMVRFGNVLGSSGSVVPLFKQQIKEGGPITVTDKDIIRYFMTIPEAVELVIQAGAMGTGGDVFVLDMGKPVRIDDLA
ncbi:MAG TPA: polysaccharide biosynthesis protein, partial [Candidatus Thioglobus autotrophicus]|nr:polysaccharide biosynthesis protein [Candidatus Thioglobus autotrophicus]